MRGKMDRGRIDERMDGKKEGQLEGKVKEIIDGKKKSENEGYTDK